MFHYDGKYHPDHELLYDVKQKTTGANVHNVDGLTIIYHCVINGLNNGKTLTPDRQQIIDKVEHRLKLFVATGELS